jgi:proline iminopeptidase
MTEAKLAVTRGHELWFGTGGVLSGTPVCIVHGGPGGRSRPESAQWFRDVSARWIMFDQRGCGRSTYSGNPLEGNTLHDLVEDMEALRIALSLERWAICGGSWGALVALRYALRFPQRVTGLMFRSPFLGTLHEINGFFERMPAWLGVAGRQALDIAPGASAQQVLQKLAQLLHADEASAQLAARVWDAFENDLGETQMTDLPSSEGVTITRPSPRLNAALSAVVQRHQANEAQLFKFRLQAHFLSQACFLEADWQQQLEQGFIGQLDRLPVEIVQGDSDAVCPPYAAQQLLKACPRAMMTWVSGAGHDMRAPDMHEALTAAATRWVSRMQP